MTRVILLTGMVMFSLSFGSGPAAAQQGDTIHVDTTHAVAAATEEAHHLPPGFIVLPFVALLLMIATGPLFYKHFWEHHYHQVSIGLGTITVVFYLVVLQDAHSLFHTLSEYISFISLLTALFVASGGILITLDRKATPLLNSAILFFGCVIANLIGTTGASMLLIRPFMRINQGRIKPYHVIFFIFTVSNVGGALTPIGDPPLFLGFLKGVPFFWVIEHVAHVWLLALILIIAVFFVIDTMNKEQGSTAVHTGKFSIRGQKNFIYLFLVIVAVFMDPNVIEGFPNLSELLHVPFGIREIAMFAIAFVAYRTADKEALRGNEFNFAPIKEVAWLFIGIFATMVPALQLVQAYASHPEVASTLTPGLFYWSTGVLSSFLDNAPTYLSFLSAAVGKFHVTGGMEALKDFSGLETTLGPPSVPWMMGAFHITEFEEYLLAISIGAVFFGANTYIGNGPNFMVKSIAEQRGVECPSFFGYIVKYSVPILIPIFTLVWFLFFKA